MRIPFATLRSQLETEDTPPSSVSSSDTEQDTSQPAHREPLSRYLSEPGPRSPHLDPTGPGPGGGPGPGPGQSRRGSFSSSHPHHSPRHHPQQAPEPSPLLAGPSRRNSFPDIPTYDEALAADPDANTDVPGIRALTLSAYNRDEAGPSLAGISTSGPEDDDDPLIPRIIRAPPDRVLRPLRRATEPVLPSRPPTPTPEEVDAEVAEWDSTAVRTNGDNSLPGVVARAQLDPTSPAQATLELPAPPADALPSYSPHLARDELRLISTVHLDQNHPAAAFFSQMTASAITANPLASPPPAAEERTTGGKKLRLTVTSGGELMGGTGRMFVRLGRGGIVEGKIQVGKVDHATGLEVSIIGLVNTSYYVRGQYTLIDTLPLARRQLILYPPPEDEATANGHTPQQNGTSTTHGTANGTAASASGTTSNGEAPNSTSPTATSNTNGTQPTANGATTQNGSAETTQRPSILSLYPDSPARRTSTQPIEPHEPYTVSNEGAHGAMTEPGQPYDPSSERNNPVKNFDFRHFKKLDPVYEDYVPQFSTFTFSIRMPEHYYRDENVPLPPSAQIFQVGMQAAVEYFLRIKLTRKSWRLNEAIGVPIIYEPRAFVTPRRLRALTTDDILNPGWRTIRLHGGTPNKSSETSPPAQPPAPGVEVSLLLPSPPILYVPSDAPPPPIPFHLHFHSSSALPLATFSDPNECHFIIRLMRVASMRIGTEREMRRMEIPSKVEIWQEGGPHLVLGPESRPTTTAPSDFSAARNATPRPGSSGSASGTAPTNNTTATTATSPSTSTSGHSSRRRSFTDRAPSFLRRRSSSTTASSPTAQTASSSSVSTGTTPISPVSPVAPTAMSRVLSTPGEPPIQEEPENINSSNANTADVPTPNGEPAASTPTPTSAPAAGPASTPVDLPTHTTGSESVLTPLPLGATDVHLLGQLTLALPENGPLLLRTLVQSFMTPEIGVTYVLEVGLQPKSGAVKEAFSHVWGGGLIEIVLGPRRSDDRSMRTGLVPVVV